MEAWRAHVTSLEDPPLLLDLKGFVHQVRLINPLASVEHVKQLGEQLQVCWVTFFLIFHKLHGVKKKKIINLDSFLF